MLKKVKRTRLHSRRGKRVNKNIRHSRKQTKKQLQVQGQVQDGGSASNSYDNQIKNEVGNKEKFQVTTFRSINQDDLDRFKISNYVNKNIDWKGFPGPPPSDCCIM
jgi:hypothetical protein